MTSTGDERKETMTETVYKAIPVEYKGIQFRSRMEGRIARLLDNLGLEWEYEPITENGFTPDFRIKADSEENDLWIEAKYYMRGEGISSDADKIERFSKSHFIIIGGALPERQYTNDWSSFVHRMIEISSNNCIGYNPYGFAPWNYASIVGEAEGDETDMTMLVQKKNGAIGLSTIEFADYVDQEKTLRAYYDATTYVFDAITEKQQEVIEQLQEENASLKCNTLKLTKGEKRTARKQLVMKPSIKKGMEELAKQHDLSFNDFIHQLFEGILEGKIRIE